MKRFIIILLSAFMLMSCVSTSTSTKPHRIKVEETYVGYTKDYTRVPIKFTYYYEQPGIPSWVDKELRPSFARMQGQERLLFSSFLRRVVHNTVYKYTLSNLLNEVTLATLKDSIEVQIACFILEHDLNINNYSFIINVEENISGL